MPVPLVLDTDIGSDVDDALALALAIRHPEIELRAVTTVSGDTTTRAKLAASLLVLSGCEGVEVAAGVRVDADAGNWFGHETSGWPPRGDVELSARDGVAVLTTIDPGTVVATIGMQSNVAAAVTRDPSVVGRTSLLALMGGSFGPVVAMDGTEYPPGDWNLVCDPEGALVALNAGFEALYVPVDVTFGCPLRRHHLERLRRGDDLCGALAQLIDVWYEQRLVPRGRGEESDVVALLHDPLTVACVVERSFVTVERMPVRVGMIEGVPRTIVDEKLGREADVVRSCDADTFADWWLETVLSP